MGAHLARMIGEARRGASARRGPPWRADSHRAASWHPPRRSCRRADAPAGRGGCGRLRPNRRCLRHEVAMLQHAGHFHHAAQLDLAPTAAHVRGAQRGHQPAGLRREARPASRAGCAPVRAAPHRRRRAPSPVPGFWRRRCRAKLRHGATTAAAESLRRLRRRRRAVGDFAQHRGFANFALRAAQEQTRPGRIRQRKQRTGRMPSILEQDGIDAGFLRPRAAAEEAGPGEPRNRAARPPSRRRENPPVRARPHGASFRASSGG